MIPDHYKTLGISRNATKSEIKRAYRTLALQWHPDRNKSHVAHQKFIEINKAYLLLSDDATRTMYNREYDLYMQRQQRRADVQRNDSYTTVEIYQDQDLNDWSKRAEEKAEKYASMSFNEFSEMVETIIKEAGAWGALLILYGIRSVAIAYAFVCFSYGIKDNDGDVILISLLLTGIAIGGSTLFKKILADKMNQPER